MRRGSLTMVSPSSEQEVTFINDPDVEFPPERTAEPFVEDADAVPKRLDMDRSDIESFVINAQRMEEKNALNVVRNEAKETATEWLKKKSGQQRLRTDVFLLLQQSSIEEGDGTMTEAEAAELATKTFIDDYVQEAVAEAQQDIDRERRAIIQELCSMTRRDSKDRSSRTGTMNSIDFSIDAA